MNEWPPGGQDLLLDRMQVRYLPSLDAIDLAGLLDDPDLGRIAVVSSFGAESAALLHYLTTIRPGLPTIFLDTGKHFPETLAYRDELVKLLDINLIVARPTAAMCASEDPHDTLHATEPNVCCTIRKTFPLQDALMGYDCWISGRKRFHGTTRAALPLIERDGKMLKINPLALWSKDEIEAWFDRYDLPRHPLEAQGFVSIGCAPCTRSVKPGENGRDGRWPQMPDKTECGIHLGPGGRFHRGSD